MQESFKVQCLQKVGYFMDANIADIKMNAKSALKMKMEKCIMT